MLVTVTNTSQFVISSPLGLLTPGATLSDNLFASRRLELVGRDLAALAAAGLCRYTVGDDATIPDAAEYTTRGDVAARFFQSGIITTTGALQYIAHGLGVAPRFTQVQLLDPSTTVTLIEGWSTGVTADGSGLLGATTAGTGTAATCTIALAGAATTVFTVVINGQPVSVTWGTGDSNTATALAAAIIAAFPNLLTSATGGGATVTMTALLGGLAGNSISVSATATTGAVKTVSINGVAASASQSGFFGTGTATAGADTNKSKGTLTIAPTVIPVPSAQVGFTVGPLTVSVPWATSNNATATALAAAANLVPAFNASYIATVSTNTVIVEKQAGGAYGNLVQFSPFGSHDATNLVFNGTTGKRFKVLAFA